MFDCCCCTVVLSAINSLWIWGTAQKNAALQREQFQLTDLITTKPPNWHQPGFGMASQSWRLYRYVHCINAFGIAVDSVHKALGALSRMLERSPSHWLAHSVA